MAGSLTKIQFRVMEPQQNLKTQGNNLLLHLFSFNELNKVMWKQPPTTKERMCISIRFFKRNISKC